MTYRVPLAYNTFGDAELAAVQRVLQSGRYTQGAEVEAFEQAFALMHGARYAIVVNSGSSANLIAIEGVAYLSQLKPEITHGVLERGDEVIIQGLNWPSTLTPLLNHGLEPIFCDVDGDSLNATVATVDAVRSNRTRMVVAVPVLGNPHGLDELRAYCQSNRLVLIEDACESLGAMTPGGRPVGTAGFASAFSFYFSHHISTIEGGAILTDNADLADICYALRSHGWTRHLKFNRSLFGPESTVVDPRFCFALPGYNVRATDINAAIGRVQLERLPEMLTSRRRIAEGRIAALKDLREYVVVPGSDHGQRHSWMTLPLLFKNLEHRKRAALSLEAAGIETRPIIVGNVLRHPIATRLRLSARQRPLPVCDSIFERGIMIGLNPFSSDETEAFIHEALRVAAKA